MSRRFSLLIADQDSESCSRIGAALERDGYRVLCVESGQEAIRVTKAEAIHGAVLSMQLPDLSGIETLRKIQSLVDAVPSILISTEPWKELQLEALDMGVSSFMQKPIAEEILRTTVAKLLDRRWPEGSLKFSIEIYRGPKETKSKNKTEEK